MLDLCWIGLAAFNFLRVSTSLDDQERESRMSGCSGRKNAFLSLISWESILCCCAERKDRSGMKRPRRRRHDGDPIARLSYWPGREPLRSGGALECGLWRRCTRSGPNSIRWMHRLAFSRHGAVPGGGAGKSAGSPSGQKTGFWLRSTTCFRKIGGTWLLVHMQSSRCRSML